MSFKWTALIVALVSLAVLSNEMYIRRLKARLEQAEEGHLRCISGFLEGPKVGQQR